MNVADHGSSADFDENRNVHALPRFPWFQAGPRAVRPLAGSWSSAPSPSPASSWPWLRLFGSAVMASVSLSKIAVPQEELLAVSAIYGRFGWAGHWGFEGVVLWRRLVKGDWND